MNRGAAIHGSFFIPLGAPPNILSFNWPENWTGPSLSRRLTSGHSAVFTCYRSEETERQTEWVKGSNEWERQRRIPQHTCAGIKLSSVPRHLLFFLLHPSAHDPPTPQHTSIVCALLYLTGTPVNATWKSWMWTGRERKNECYRAREAAREGERETLRDVLSLIKLASTKAGWKAQSWHSVAGCTRTHKSLPGLKCLHDALCGFRLQYKRASVKKKCIIIPGSVNENGALCPFLRADERSFLFMVIGI